jgi:uncharacterized protein
MKANPAPQLVCSGLWRWLQGAGLERFEFLRSGNGWIMRGTIVTLADDVATEAKYELACDDSFRTTRAQVSVREPGTERSLHIEAENGRWYENGRENPNVKGAIDIDLGWSPSTNTLPIRRLKLQIGQSSGEFHAAWVRFPELVLEPLAQEYLRLSDHLYRYSSRSGAFSADLLVDEHGVVLNYQGFWERVQNPVSS